MCQNVGIVVSYLTKIFIIWGSFRKTNSDRTPRRKKVGRGFGCPTPGERPSGRPLGTPPGFEQLGAIARSYRSSEPKLVCEAAACRSIRKILHSLGSRFYLHGLAPCDQTLDTYLNHLVLYNRVRSPSDQLNLETFIQLNLSCESSRVLGQTV